MKQTKDKPEVLRFSAVIEADTTREYAAVPTEIYQKVAGMPKLEGTINDQPFRANVDELDGGGRIRVNTAMLNGAKAVVGDVTSFVVLGPEPDPIPAPDLQARFDEAPAAVQIWEELTVLAKRDWLRWIDDTKNPDTRARRIDRTISQLAEGKRRACCVNVNSFMLNRIKEDDEAL